MLAQKTKEESAQNLSSFPNARETVPPFHEDHYYELEAKHREQTVYTYIPHLRRKFNGEKEDFDALPQEERFQLYELFMLGKATCLWDEIEKVKTRRKYTNRVKRSNSKKINEIMEVLEGNPKVKAEDLMNFLPKKVFSRLMLYVKYAGNNRDTIRRFFENMEK
ncbi:hypothetical protein JW721_01835 [Candidatus Micrarchaeota archaeon]|nr:hypothetical protein [Candidatus Micrarchaeota archaeon]